MKPFELLLSVIMLAIQSYAATVISFKQLNNKKGNSFINKLAFFILLWIYCVFVFYLIPNHLRLILSIIVISILLHRVLKDSYIKLLICSFNTEMLLSISEIIVSVVLVLLGFNPKDIVTIPIYNLIANVAISLFAIALIYIPVVKKIIMLIYDLANKNKKFVLNIFVTILTVYLVVAKNGLEFVLKSNYYVNILFILIVAFIFVFIIKIEFKYAQIDSENKMMLKFVTKYEKIITEQGKRNHEFKNQLMVIRGYAQMNSPKLIEYIDSLASDLNKGQSSFLISQLNKFPEGGIKGLLYYKLSLMEDYKIIYEIIVEKSVKTCLNKLKTSDYINITKILGVLLDNAIESSNKSINKKIIIDVKKDKGFVIFKIYNTYKGKIDLSKIGTGYTTKGKGHGYGLRLVNDIVLNDDNLVLYNDVEEGYFVSSFEINVSKIKNTK